MLKQVPLLYKLQMCNESFYFHLNATSKSFVHIYFKYKKLQLQNNDYYLNCGILYFMTIFSFFEDEQTI